MPTLPTFDFISEADSAFYLYEDGKISFSLCWDLTCDGWVSREGTVNTLFWRRWLCEFLRKVQLRPWNQSYLTKRILTILLDLQVYHKKEFCAMFRVNRVHEVGTIQAVPIKVYDYYEPGWIFLVSILSFLYFAWKSERRSKPLKYMIIIFQRNRYSFWRALIGSRSSQNPWLVFIKATNISYCELYAMASRFSPVSDKKHFCLKTKKILISANTKRGVLGFNGFRNCWKSKRVLSKHARQM